MIIWGSLACKLPSSLPTSARWRRSGSGVGVGRQVGIWRASRSIVLFGDWLLETSPGSKLTISLQVELKAGHFPSSKAQRRPFPFKWSSKPTISLQVKLKVDHFPSSEAQSTIFWRTFHYWHKMLTDQSNKGLSMCETKKGAAEKGHRINPYTSKNLSSQTPDRPPLAAILVVIIK